MLRKLEHAMQTWRLREKLSPEEYTLARRMDVELLAVLERLDKRVRELEVSDL